MHGLYFKKVIRYQGTYNSLYHRCYWVLCNFNGNKWKIFYLSFKMLLMCIFKNIKIKSVKSPFGFELIDEDEYVHRRVCTGFYTNILLMGAIAF